MLPRHALDPFLLLGRVVVLGASGFIGRRVIQSLKQSGGAQVVAVSRHATAIREDGVEAVDLDVSNHEALAAVLRGASGIVNCVTGSPELIVSTTAAVLALAAKEASAPAVVNLGSLAAYGSTTGRVLESAPLRGDGGPYSAAKAEADRLGGQHPFVVTLRPGIVYGPGSSWWSDRIARLLVHGRLGDLGAAGAGHCNLVYVDDVASAAVRALDLPENERGPFNLSCPVPFTWNDYFAEYATALHAAPLRTISPGRLRVETRILSLPLKLMETLLITRSLACWNPWPPVRPWLAAICAHDIRLDVTRAESRLGMGWTPIETGLRQSAQWFLAGGRTRR